MNKTIEYTIVTILFLSSLLQLSPEARADTHAGLLDELKQAVADTNLTSDFTQTGPITLDAALGNIGVSGSGSPTLTIYSCSNDLNGNGKAGFSVGSGKTLKILNAGSLNTDGTVNNSWHGFSGSSNGGVVNNSGSVSIDSSVFSGNSVTNNGGVIYNSANASIINSTFRGNNARYDGGAIYNESGGSVTISNSKFIGNSSSTDDGGSIKNFGVLNLTDSEFHSNNALWGGALTSLSSSANVTIKHTIFEGNYASRHGGAIYNGEHSNSLSIDDGTFTGNSTSGNAGAIFSETPLAVINSQFTGNNSSGDGGAIYYNYSGAVLKIDNNKFNNNYSSGSGGAIFSAAQMQISNGSSFTGNGVSSSGSIKTYNGGAIFANNNAPLTIDNSTFSGNEANNNGGAISSDASLTIGASGATTFTNNFAGSSGGAIYSTGVLSIGDTTFSGNKSNGNGGAVNASANTTISNATFTVNSSTSSGGAIFSNVSSSSTTSIDYGTFTNNTANGSGGAIYNNNTGAISISNSTFSGNGNSTSGGTTTVNSDYGGAIYNNQAAITLTNTDFVNNTAKTYGGAISTGSNGSLTIIGGTYTGNYSNSTDYSRGGGAIYNNNIMSITSGTTFTANGLDASGNIKTGCGGAIYSNSDVSDSITIENATFKDNAAKQSGGAIFNNNGTINLSSDTFENNYNNTLDNSRGGGAFANNNAGVIIISNSQFTNNGVDANGNVQSYFGGAIHNNTSSNTASTIDNSTFTGNQTLNEGGAIYNLRGILNITNSRFISNQAVTQGGAILNNGPLSISNSDFEGNYNRDGGNGGAIYNWDNTLTLSNSTFTGNGIDGSGNIETYNGGAIYHRNNTINIIDSTFTGNKASNQGGAIYVENATLNVKASAGGTTYFTGNYDVTGKNDIYIAGGTLNLNAGAGGKITFDDPIKASNHNIYINSSSVDSALTTGTVNFNDIVTANTIYLYNGTTNFLKYASLQSLNISGGIVNIGSTNADAITYSSNSFTLPAGTLNLYNTIFNGSAMLTVNNSAAALNIYDSKFDGSTYSSSNSVLNASAGSLKVDNTAFNNFKYNDTHGTINNSSATLTVIDSQFNNDKAWQGCAIYNTNGTTTITDSLFTNNSARDRGGAIYNNSGTLNIQASANTSTIFSGNTDTSGSNDIYLNGGTLNLNAGNNGIISFDGQIMSSSINNGIEINSNSVNSSLNTGTVIFNNQTSNASINLYGGTLSLGKDNNTTTSTYLSNVNLTLTGGTLDIQNQKATDILALNNLTIPTEATSGLTMDADLNANINDKITVSGTATGTLALNNINLLSDSTASSFKLTLVQATGSGDISGLALGSSTIYTNAYEYIFTQSSTAGQYDVLRSAFAGLNYFVKDTGASRAFSVTSDANAEYALGAIGGTNDTLTIYGNTKNVNGLGYGGISIAADQTLSISGVGALNNDGSVKTSWNGFAGADGGAISNSGKLSITNSIFSGNTASDKGGVVYNNSSEISTITGSTFEGNSATNSGAAIYNESGTVNINNSSFVSNTTTDSSSKGGAIYNKSGTVNIVNSSFVNNNTTGTYSQGGAIYNEAGALNIQSTAANTTLFSGNTDGTGSNAIYLAGGTLNLNAGPNGSITFDDKISSSSINNQIAINSSSVNQALTSGTVVFNNLVSDASINLDGGTLSLGKDNNTATSTYLSNVNLTLNAGTLDMQNQKVSDNLLLNNLTIPTGSTSALTIDADFASGTNDKITIAGNATGKLTLSNINILSDSTSKAFTMEIVRATGGGNISGLSLADAIANLSYYEYDFTQSSTPGIYNVVRLSCGRLNTIVSNTDASRTFSSQEDEYAKYAFGAMGGNSSTLKIYGNSYGIYGRQYSGINVSSNQTLNIYSVGSVDESDNILSSWNGFSSTNNGAAISNSGNLSIADSVFYNNSTSSNGGAVYNTSSTGSTTITNSVFSKNRAISSQGGAIYTDNGTVNVSDSKFISNKAPNGGAIYAYGTLTVLDSYFNSNIASSNAGAIYNNNSGTITNSHFSDNSSSGDGGGIRNLGLLTVTDTTFDSNNAQYGGAINNYNSNADLKIYNSHFYNNTSTNLGGAICNGSNAKSVIIDNTDFSGNISSNNGGAIYTENPFTIKNGSSFTSNSANNGGGIYNKGLLTILDATFTGNSALNYGGAIYNEQGTLDIQASAGKTTSFSGNTDRTGSNAIYMQNGTLNLNAGAGGTISFGDSISASGHDITINSPDIASTLTTGTISFNNNVTAANIYMKDGTTNYYVTPNLSGTYYIQGGTADFYKYVALNSINLASGTLNIGDLSSAQISYSGANLNVTAGNVKFENINFSGNSSLILNNASSKLSIIGSTFNGSGYTSTNSILTNELGTLFIDPTTFNGYTTAANGGVINNSSTLNVENTTFSNNSTTSNGGAIYNNASGYISTIDGSIFSSNSAITIGGAIYNAAGTLNITNSVFNGNYTTDSASTGGAITNEGTMTINSGSSFSGNGVNSSGYTKTNNGGAIYNKGSLTIADATFTGNMALGLGGAIYNETGTVNVQASATGTTTFSGNQDGTGSNAIYLAGGNLNLNAGEGGTIKIDDKIDSTSINNAISINSDTVNPSLTTGTIILNNTLSNASVTLNSGTLTLGENGNTKTNTYLSNVNLTLSGGTLDMQNNNVADVLALNNLIIPNGSTAKLTIDADLAAGTNDKITVAGTAQGALTINSVNLLTDATSTHSIMSIVSGSGNLTALELPKITIYTQLAEYILTQDSTDKGSYDVLRTLLAGLNYAVKSTISTRIFSATADANAEYALGAMGGEKLTIYGNHNNVNMNNYSGIVVASGQTLNINDVGSVTSDGNILASWNGANASNGSVVNNSGTLAIKDSVFSNNFASSNAGVIYNNSTGTATIEDSYFSQNSTLGDGGAIKNLGNMTIRNSTFISNNSAYATVNNYDTNASLWIYNSHFINNSSTNLGGAICNDNNSNLLYINTTEFKGNSVSASSGGAIYTSMPTTIISSQFLENHASENGGAIFNKDATTDISDTSFSDNYASSLGGAIYNEGGSLNISRGLFTGNYTTSNSVLSNGGGAIYNAGGTLTISDSTFTNNTSANYGGAIYNATGALNIQASAGNSTSFSGNNDVTGSNAIYIAGGTLNLNAGEGGTIKFDDKIDSSSRNNQININSSAVNSSLTTGTVILNNTVSNAYVTLNSGTLTLGEDNNTKTNTYMSNVNLTLAGGTLDMENKNANDIISLNNLTITNGSTAKLTIDADLSTGQNDKIDIFGTATGTLSLGHINILADSDLENFLFNFITVESGANISGLRLADYVAYTGDYEYDFSQSSTLGAYNVDRIELHPAHGINTAVESTAKNRSFSAIGNDTAFYGLGNMGGTNSTLTIYGNSNNINGAGFSGVNVLSGQKLNIIGVGSLNSADKILTAWNGFSSVNGGAINNIGTVTITDSIFASNKASSLGGAIYNAGNLNIQASENAKTLFAGNIDSTGANAIYMATGSTLNLNAGAGGSITFNDAISSASSDNAININSGTVNSSLTTGTVNFNNSVSNSNVIVNAGSVNVGAATLSNDKFTMLGGKTTFSGTSLVNNSNIFVNNSAAQTILNGVTMKGANYTDTAPVLNVASGSLNIANSIFSGYSTASVINNAGNSTTVSGSIFSKNSAGAIVNSGTTTIINSTFANNSSATSSGAINNSGILNIIASGAETKFTNNKASGSLRDIYLQSGSTLNLNAGNGGAITFNSGIASANINNEINVNKTNSTYPTNGAVILNSAVTNSTVNLYNGMLAMSNDSNLNGDNVNISGGVLNLANNQLGVAKFNNLNLSGNSYLRLDADLARGLSDKITAATVTSTNGGMLTISGLNIMSDISDRTNLDIADANLRNYVALGATTASTPISNYNLSYNPSTGSLNVSNAGFNPSILATPTSSLAGMYVTQTNTYHEAFANIDSIMSMPRYDRLLLNYGTKTASADGQFVFSPTLLPEDQAGYWVKQFTTFESVPLNNGPNVSNVAYGMLVGRDSALKHFKNGCNAYLTGYFGYTGSHQNYDNVGSYQNGGLLGLTGTVYKGNFFAALTGNVGASNGNNYTSFGVDNYTTIMAGLAMKTGYNYEIFSGKLIIQPSISVSYTFADTLDYTTASGVRINSDPLNAVQVVPGLKLIGNLKNGWQPYIGVSMVYNFMDRSRFYANNVELPQTSVDPYVEYGFGLQRKWGDRATGFGQAMLRGGGRNGVALQFGFRWAVGK